MDTKYKTLKSLKQLTVFLGQCWQHLGSGPEDDDHALVHVAGPVVAARGVAVAAHFERELVDDELAEVLGTVVEEPAGHVNTI